MLSALAQIIIIIIVRVDSSVKLACLLLHVLVPSSQN